jgi:hypothetical protein
MDFTPIKGVNYKYNYTRIFEDIASKKVDEQKAHGWLKYLCLEDLWFMIYFILKVEPANHPWVVAACREVEDGPDDMTLELWAREHFKSTIFTIGETVQKMLKNPESRVGIFSHTKPNAKGFLRSIKILFESNQELKQLFPEILYENPHRDSPKWSEDDGLVLKRRGFYKESTIEANGLIEGMPVGKHYTDLVFDDIETQDVVATPEQIRKLKTMFDLAQNLGTQDSKQRVIGTTYHHQGVLMYVKEKADIHGKKIYNTRIKPATDDGTPSGKPVLLTQKKLDQLKSNEYVFACQQLLNPTPIGVRRFNSEDLKITKKEDIPSDLELFMTIDPAGDAFDKVRGDSWAVLLCGVDAEIDSLGASNVFVLDAMIDKMKPTEAIEEIVRMYLRGGYIQKVGVEKVALSEVEIHVKKALEKAGRRISVEDKTLVILRPSGRSKNKRIEGALAWPFSNSKIHVSDNVPEKYIEIMKEEMDTYPYSGKDDFLDGLAYLYDMIMDHTFMTKRKAAYWLEKANSAYRPMDKVAGY